MSETNDSVRRVPGFLYLDMDRVKSISARIDQGYIKERVEEQEENEEVAASIYGSIKASIFGSLGPSAETGGEVSGGYSTSTRSQEAKALHHYYFDLLEQWLEEAEDEWYHDVNSMMEEVGGEGALLSRFRDRVEEGDIIRVSGTINFLDFRTSMDLMAGFFEAIDLIEEFQTEAIREQLSGNTIEEVDIREISDMGFREFKSLEPLFRTFQTILPNEYREMLVAELNPYTSNNGFLFWATVKRAKLETSPVELLSKHQSSEIPNCTMLARVESITTESEQDDSVAEDVDQESDFEFGELLHAADDLGSDFDLKVEYPNISVSPIAIYR